MGSAAWTHPLAEVGSEYRGLWGHAGKQGGLHRGGDHLNSEGRGGSSVLPRKGLYKDLETRTEAWSVQTRVSGPWPWRGRLRASS